MMDESRWDEGDEGDEDEGRPGDHLARLVKAELHPTEYLLWADRPVPPRARAIPLVPAVFVSVVAGLSGFSLAAMFGLIGQAWSDWRTLAVVFGLAPAVLGGLIVAQQLGLAVRRLVVRRKLSRLIYAVTDHRAIVARIESATGCLSAWSLHRGEVEDTRRFENPDGSGDLYFLGSGSDHWLPFGFLEVPRVGRVESLARETLLDVDQDWWKLDRAGAP
jgi:hypothetical protein